jgi:hypothetical protein
MSYLGEEISSIINEELKDLVYSATLDKITPGTRTAGSLTSGTNPTTISHSCKGYISTFNDTQFPNTLVQNGDRAVVLLADSLTVIPAPGDKVTIQANTYTIREKGVERDPSTSIYKLHCGVN